MARHTRQAVMVAALGLLGGCVSLGASNPPSRLYTLSAVQAAPAGAPATGRAPIAVAQPDTERMLSYPRLLVQEGPTHVSYFKDAAWAERPARLFRALLAETLRARGGRLVVEDDTPAVTGQRLGGRLLAMSYDAPSHTALVRYDALLVMPDGTMRGRRFEAAQPHVPAKPEAVAEALNLAANTVAQQVADWAQ